MAKDGKKGFRAEFKEFITRGNVIDLAVGVIVGSAFTAIVNSLVNDIFNPIIGYFIGGINFDQLIIKLPETIPGTESATITYGAFINSVVTFLLTALVVFCLVKFINSFHRKKDVEAEEAAAEAELPPDVQLLTEIRDLLKNGASLPSETASVIDAAVLEKEEVIEQPEKTAETAAEAEKAKTEKKTIE